MIVLSASFRKDQHDFVMLIRQGDVCLFAKKKETDSRWHYEVVLVQREKDCTWPGGLFTPAHERLPGNERWGELGWTPCDWERAVELFEEKVQEEEFSILKPKWVVANLKDYR